MPDRVPLGLYVHWPYCARICPYCDFNVRPEKQQDTGFLVDAICADIRYWQRKLDEPRPLASVSFGGGTPSRLLPQQMRTILQSAETAFGFTLDIEISLEANPTDMETDRYQAFAALGVGRLSLGMQSLSDDELQFLGRDHNADQALRALEAAQNSFTHVSADFIYGLPDQSLAGWDRSLQAILDLGVAHLSLYCLTIEAKTAFAQRQKRGQLVPVGDDGMADLFELTQKKARSAGMPAYEISNHARGAEEQSLHNLLYWQGGDWIGVGPGAHGRVQVSGQRQEAATILRPQNYAEAVAKTGTGTDVLAPLSAQDDLAERLLLGLRLSSGIDLQTLQNRAGAKIEAGRLQRALDLQIVQIRQGNLLATNPLLVDRVVLELLD
jgi:oxygen-independent coproporphyrinogen-3 oxidase